MLLRLFNMRITLCFTISAFIFYGIGIYIAIQMVEIYVISPIQAIYLPCIALIPYCFFYVVCLYIANPTLKIKEVIYLKIEDKLDEEEKSKFKRYLINFETLGMLMCKFFGFDKSFCKKYIKYFIEREVLRIRKLDKKNQLKRVSLLKSIKSINSL